MKTKTGNVRILKEALDKWGDNSNRATIMDPQITIFYGDDKEGLLMTRKLRAILRDYGERVAISNSLVLDILNAYMKKSAQLKKAEAEIRENKKKIADYERKLRIIKKLVAKVEIESKEKK